MDEERSIIAGYDGSEHARKALVWAADAAARSGRDLIVLTVAADDEGVCLRGPVSMSHRWLHDLEEHAYETSASGALLARRLVPGVSARSFSVLGSPARVLIEASQNTALLVVGTRARNAGVEIALGSVAESVAGRCRCPVVVVPGGVTAHPDHDHPVVVGVDGSPDALRAVQRAALTATDAGARLTVVAAASHDGSSNSAQEQDAVAAAVNAARATCSALRVRGIVTEGRPPAVLAREAARAGLIVVGSAGHGAARKAVLGSISRAVILSAPCPVMVIGPDCDLRAAPPATAEARVPQQA